MTIELYETILLKDGRKASIVEILGDHDLYIADVENGVDYDTITITPEQIKRVIQ